MVYGQPVGKSRFSAVVLGVLLLALCMCAGCRSKTPPPASACTLPSKIKLEATERINPNSAGEALPTQVRLYQLKEIVKVEEADFAAIWEQPKETLADDLLQVQEFTLFPGQTELVDVALTPAARYLVGVAIFRRPTGNQWRSVIPLPASERLCAAYKERGAPQPAIVFRFDQYRIESKSRLLTAGGDHDLPVDVAPDRPREKKKAD
jgi:type VI secretion system protein VasD